MELAATFNLNVTFHNRKYTKNSLGGKSLSIKLTAVVEKSKPLGILTDIAKDITNRLKNAAIVHRSDPVLIRYIEPKDGNTVHTRLDQIRNGLVGYGYEILGTTIPPETVNGYRVLVLGEKYDATLEGLAEWIIREYQPVDVVTIVDGDVSVKLSDADVDQLLL